MEEEEEEVLLLSLLINFESVKRMVLDPSETTITVTNPQKMCRDKRKRKLYNREEQKHYQMVYTKCRRLDNYDTELWVLIIKDTVMESSFVIFVNIYCE